MGSFLTNYHDGTVEYTINLDKAFNQQNYYSAAIFDHYFDECHNTECPYTAIDSTVAPDSGSESMVNGYFALSDPGTYRFHT